MALVVFLRGVNVGGHRTFRPSVLTRQLRRFDVVNIGAAGTFVVRKPGSQALFRAALARSLPFETHVMMCTGRELLRLASSKPFAGRKSRADVVPFVTVLAKRCTPTSPLPCRFPPTGAWGLQVLGQDGRLVYGVYRRTMKAIGQLGQLDKLFGAPATTRNWNTIAAIARVLSE